jgi:UDP:flavonoid glycosyltransferase YjiC (YdhE family)
VKKIGEFIYPWGSGHYSRMMALNNFLPEYIKDEIEIHYSSKSEIYQRLLNKFPTKRDFIHEILMPTPIDGKMGPSVLLSMLNLVLPVSKNPPLLKQISDYLKSERRLYDKEKFDLVINDGDMGSNVIAKNRAIPTLFITNQFRPKLWKSRFYFYPSLVFISKQIAKATRIIVADSPPPYTICEYNLNFPEKIKEKVTYVGHFASSRIIESKSRTDLEKLIENEKFGYWMRTGNQSTNDITGKTFEEIFHDEQMKDKKRIISHAKNDQSINKVTGKDGRVYSISDALERKIDWIQIDIGFLSEAEKQTVLKFSNYVVVNGSHTVMGEILGINSKPVIGIPVYDEHTNNLRWAEEKNLGVMAKNKKHAIKAISTILNNYNRFQEQLDIFSKNFVINGAEKTAKIASDMLDKKT